MTSEVALYWIQEALKMALLLVGPLLGVALIVGLIVSLLQAITSVQEMTLSYIPKILAVGFVLLLLAPWMLQMLTDFVVQVLQFIPNVSH